MIGETLLTNLFKFGEDELKIVNNLKLFPEDVKFAENIRNKGALALAWGSFSAVVVELGSKKWNFMRSPNCLPNVIGRSIFHGSAFYVAYLATVNRFYESKIDQLKTPIGRFLASSCENFKTTDHIVQQLHSQTCRRERLEAKHRVNVESNSSNDRIAEFIMFVLVAEKLSTYKKWYCLKELFPPTEIDRCPESRTIKSDEDLKFRIEQLNLTTVESEIEYRLLLGYGFFLLSSFLLIKSMSMYYKASFKHLQLIPILYGVFWSQDNARRWWLRQDSPLAQIARDHYFGERNPDLLLARAELKSEEGHYTELRKNSMKHWFASSLYGDFNAILQQLYKNYI